MLLMLMIQIDYEGHKQVGTATSADEVLVDAKKDVFVPKEDNSLYVPNLIPDTVYTFNISAKFLDGSYGATYSIHLDTEDLESHAASRGVGLCLLSCKHDMCRLFLKPFKAGGNYAVVLAS